MSNTGNSQAGKTARALRWRRGVGLLCGVAAIALGIFIVQRFYSGRRQASNPRNHPGSCPAKSFARISGVVGAQRSYDLSYSSELCSDAGCTPLLTVKGRLLTLSRASANRCEDTIAVRLNAERPTDADQAKLQNLAALSTAIDLRYGTNGNLASVAYAHQVDKPTARILEGIVRELQVAVSNVNSKQGSWTSTEHIAIGDVLSKFEASASGRQISWRRIKVLVWADSDDPFTAKGGQSEIFSTHHLAALDAQGFIVRLIGTDEFVLDADGRGEKMRLRNSIDLVEAPPGDDSALAAADLGREVAAGGFTQPSERSAYADEARIAGHTLASLLQESERLRKVGKNSSGPSESRLHIAASALFRRNPEAARDAIAAVRAGHADREFLLAALGDAGTRETAAMLAELLRDGGDKSRTANVLGALARAKEADVAVAETLATTLKQPGLGGFARLMTGAFASGTQQASPKASEKAVDSLIAAYDPTESVMARADTLRGLGNAGSVKALALARTAASSSSAVERAAAAQAVRLIPSDAADRILADLMKDSESFVRRSVLDAALYRDATEILVPPTEAIARGDTEATVRREAIRVLVRWKGDAPSARTTLAWVAQNDPEDDLRRAAIEGLNRYSM